MGDDFCFRALGFLFTIEITAVTKIVLNPFIHTSTLIYELEVQIQEFFLTTLVAMFSLMEPVLGYSAFQDSSHGTYLCSSPTLG